jgi:hypothetical protein
MTVTAGFLVLGVMLAVTSPRVWRRVIRRVQVVRWRRHRYR